MGWGIFAEVLWVWCGVMVICRILLLMLEDGIQGVEDVGFLLDSLALANCHVLVPGSVRVGWLVGWLIGTVNLTCFYWVLVIDVKGACLGCGRN